MLRKKSFMTKDTKGCEFKATCFLDVNYMYDFNNGGKRTRVVIDSDYYGMGIHAKTLSELQQKVGEL